MTALHGDLRPGPSSWKWRASNLGFPSQEGIPGGKVSSPLEGIIGDVLQVIQKRALELVSSGFWCSTHDIGVGQYCLRVEGDVAETIRILFNTGFDDDSIFRADHVTIKGLDLKNINTIHTLHHDKSCRSGKPWFIIYNIQQLVSYNGYLTY